MLSNCLFTADFFYNKKKKINNQCAWNFLFSIKCRPRNRRKRCRSVLGSLLYYEHKYLSGIKHSIKVMKLSKTCLMQVGHSPLLRTITSKKSKKQCLKIAVLAKKMAEELNIAYVSTEPFWKIFWAWNYARLVPKDLNEPSHSSMIVSDLLAKHDTKVMATVCVFVRFLTENQLQRTRYESVDPDKQTAT